MRRPFRLLALLALSLGLAPVSACKRTGSSDTSPGSAGASNKSSKPKRVRRKPGLPRPLRLPATSPILIHVQSPGEVVTGLRAYAPELRAGQGLLNDLVSQLPGATEVEQTLARAVDLGRPWDAVSVDGQLIVHLPIRRVEMVASLLANKPPAGKFGAVDLQRGAAPGPKLAWLDREAKTLTLADTERGLATGRHLAREYGRKDALRIELSQAETRKYAPQFALEQLELRGMGPHQFALKAQGVPPEIFAQLGRIQPGALTGLLESDRIAVGASSKYADYDKDVRKIIGDLKHQVDRQNFLVRGNLQDLLRRLGSVLRSWNGRTMVGVGPKDHLLIGFGAENPQKMGGALFHLTNGVIDNLSLARTIGVSVPRVRLQRNKTSGAGHNISVIALEGARKYLPAEAAPLINDRGDLRIAVAFPTKSGAGLVVAGPNCHEVLREWLEDTADATAAKDTAEDYIAAVAAVDPADLQPVLQPGGNPAALLGLDASREPTRLVVVRKGNDLEVRVQGPELDTRPARAGNQRLVPRGPGQMLVPMPSGGKPAPAKPPRSKPVR
jgi:hypothetical protein